MQGVTLNTATVQQPQVKSQQCTCPNCNCHANTQVQDTFVRQSGIIPPRDYTPDPYAGLGPELSPQEKLKKKWEDVRKPMYANAPQPQQEEDASQKKTFGQKVVDKVKNFGYKVKEYFSNLFKK